MTIRTWWMLILLAAIIAAASLLGISMIQTTGAHSPFRRVALQLSPAVVNITAEKVVALRQSRSGQLDQSLPGEPPPDSQPPTPNPQPLPGLRVEHVLGTGFIFDKAGYVMTNYHVISGYDDIVIRLDNGTVFPSESIRKIGDDPWSDLAVLKIETRRRLPVARLGNSDLLEVGDWVAAVGNPFGLSGTLTAGVVSAFNRSGIPMSGGPKYQDFIQTDASVNPGNSGGPLVNEAGEVVGVNSAIRSPIRGSVGIGFAIPINFARDVAEELIQSGHIVRGYVGISTQPVDENVQQALGLRSTDGVLVSSVDSGGPGDQAGIRSGDVILRFDNQDVTDNQQFQTLAAGTDPNRLVAIELVRWGRAVATKLKVATRVDAEAKTIPEPKNRYWLGLLVHDLPPADSGTPNPQSPVRKRPTGAAVSLVETGGPAENAGIKLGDVIIGIDSYPVTGVNSYRQLGLMMRRTRKPLLIHVLRGSDEAWFAVGP